jgi:hypothetical protein
VFLTATFGPFGVFAGSLGGGSSVLSSSQPSDNVVFTVPGLPLTDASLALSFSGVGPALAQNGVTVSSFTAQNTGTFSAVVPEPATLYLSSLAIVIGPLTFWRKRFVRSHASRVSR